MALGSGGGIKWDLLSLHCSFQGDMEMELLFAALLLTILHCSKKLFIPVNDFCLLKIKSLFLFLLITPWKNTGMKMIQKYFVQEESIRDVKESLSLRFGFVLFFIFQVVPRWVSFCCF